MPKQIVSTHSRGVAHNTQPAFGIMAKGSEMPDRLKPGTDAWNKRQAIHQHNGYTGYARMMLMQARAIMDSRSTTSASKELANRIANDAKALAESLKERHWP